MTRGVIRDREFKQLNDFSGLQWGNITPTDIDGFIDFADLCFVFIEAKFAGGSMPLGQRIALARLADSIAPPRVAITILAEHHDEKADVNVGAALVVEVRYRRKWKDVRARELTVRVAIDRFLERHGMHGYNAIEGGK